MKKAAVIGDPINHSLSPILFSQMSSILGVSDLHYEACQVKSPELSGFIEKVRNEFVGLNVTIPHKQSIISLLDRLSPEAKAIGAVNVVSFENGAVGFNTDSVGITNSLVEKNIPIRDRRVLILGAGGAARAAAYSVASAGCSEVVVMNKTRDRAENLIRDLSPSFPKTRFSSTEIQGVFSLIVNSTSVGMKGTEFSEEAAEKFFSEVFGKVGLASDGIAYDLIYTPERTAFIKVAENFGFKIMGGLEMLIHQAIASWEVWFGPITGTLSKSQIKTALQKELRSSLREKPVFLSGFMGVGKSTIGRILAERMDWAFIDTDQWIERAERKTVAEIFAQEGEASFRKKELAAISEIVLKKRTIVSLGGGILTQPPNLEAIQRAGTLIYLSATVEKLSARLNKSWQKRPMLHPESSNSGAEAQKVNTQKIKDLLDVRLPTYKKADIEISTENQTPAETAALIENKILDRTFK